MSFDPFSIIGYLGTTAGLLSFLVSTITRLEQFQRDYKDSGDILSWHKTQFKTIQLSLETWKQLWSNATSDSDLDYLWGPQGHEEIRFKILLIRKEIDAIGRLLFEKSEDEQKDKLTKNDDWKRWLGQHDSRFKDTEAQAPWRKLAFASFEGANLQQRTTRLRDKVDDLKTYSNHVIWKAQSSSDNVAITDTAVRQILNRKRYVEDYSAVLTKLHSLTTRSSWSLVLSRPDSEGGPTSIDGDPIRLIFDAISQHELQGPLGIIDFYLSELKAENLHHWIHQKSLEELVIPQRRDDLHIQISCPPITDMHWRVTLIELAIGLVNWALLLWETPWTNTICICRIRFVTLPPASGKNVALPTLACQGTCLKARADHTGRKALALAVCLSELALQQVIELDAPQSATPKFILGGTRLSREELLRRVKLKAGHRYLRAVDYCFDYDDNLRRGEFRPGHILYFKEEVLDHFEAILRATIEHSES